MGLHPKRYKPSLNAIGPLVREKTFEGFTIYGCGGHFGHVTNKVSFLSSQTHLHDIWFQIPQRFFERKNNHSENQVTFGEDQE